MRRNLNTEGQTGLVFVEHAPNPHVPVATIEQVKQLEKALESGAGLSAEDLKKRKGWLTAEDLAASLGEGWSDRKVRAVARAMCPKVVSYPGSPGYKLWAACSVAEITATIDSFNSQAKDMTARAMLYESAYHSRFRGGSS
jgi:hypothetical protein